MADNMIVHVILTRPQRHRLKVIALTKGVPSSYLIRSALAAMFPSVFEEDTGSESQKGNKSSEAAND